MAGKASGVGERDAFATPRLVPPTVPSSLGFQLSRSLEPRAVAAAGPLATLFRRKDVWAHMWREAVQLERERGLGFLLAPVLLGAGAVTYFSARMEPGFTPLIAATLACAVLVLVLRSRDKGCVAVMAALLFATGMLASKVETWRAGTHIIGGEISTRLTAKVARIEHQENGRVRLTLDVFATERPVLRYAPTRVRLSARKLGPGILAGSRIVGIVRLLPPSGPVRPDGFDFAFKSYFDRIGGSGFFLRGPDLVAGGDAVSRPTVVERVENFRLGLAGRIREQLPGAEGEIAAALMVGVRAGIPEDVNESLRTTGLAHILSISGLHMALVAGVIMGAMRAGFSLFPDFSSRRPVKKYAAVFAIAATAAYLAVSGVEVAAERSFLMLAIMLTAVLFDRAALTMRNLAIAAIVVLLTSPHEVLGPSFQMSFGATAALIGAYSGWAQYRAKESRSGQPSNLSTGQWLVRKAGLFVLALAATSLVAGLATSVYGVYHFQRISPLTLLANLAVMPLVSIVVMPSAVLAAIAMPFGLDWLILPVLGHGLTAMIAIAERFAALSPPDAAGLLPVSAVMALTAALIVATVCTTWLRALALPFALMGVLLIPTREFPSVFVSEDAKLVSVRVGDGALAVNRLRPNEFTLENWTRAVQGETIIKPIAAASAAQVSAPVGAGSPFRCDEKSCLITAATGQQVVHAADADAARPFCKSAALIVIEAAADKNPCGRGQARVITGRRLAQSGSAAVTLEAGARPKPRYAIERPYRPWHEHRRFSRAARGMPPYERRPVSTGSAAAGLTPVQK